MLHQFVVQFAQFSLVFSFCLASAILFITFGLALFPLLGLSLALGISLGLPFCIGQFTTDLFATSAVGFKAILIRLLAAFFLMLFLACFAACPVL
ncbi:MAG: hypothetical protein Q8O37_16690 [Sulfuricellaceae bacterium]|nr:hypothetical protein [Sulfuricellaceae bacterium]